MNQPLDNILDLICPKVAEIEDGYVAAGRHEGDPTRTLRFDDGPGYLMPLEQARELGRKLAQ